MAEVTVLAGTRQVQVLREAPDDQASVNALTVLAGSEIDARAWRSVAYTLQVITASVNWTVFGANESDYSDEVEVQAEAAVAANATGSFSDGEAPFGHYRAKIKSTVADTPGTATLRGLAKG